MNTLLAPAALVPAQIDPFLVAALVLLVAGVVGSLLPVLPGAILSLAGVYLYWYSTGWTDPGIAFVGLVTVLGLLAMAVDFVGGIVSAKASGVSTKTALVAGVVGLVLLPILGPLGVVVGIAATVFASELRRGKPVGETIATTFKTVAGILLANVVQFLLTSIILLAFIALVVF